MRNQCHSARPWLLKRESHKAAQLCDQSQAVALSRRGGAAAWFVNGNARIQVEQRHRECIFAKQSIQ
jgi:hypothetical protein